jgi:hypothetical protein
LPPVLDVLLVVVLLVVLLSVDELDVEDELLVVELLLELLLEVLLVELELVEDVDGLVAVDVVDDVVDGLLLDVIVLDELLVSDWLHAFGLPGAPVCVWFLSPYPHPGLVWPELPGPPPLLP